MPKKNYCPSQFCLPRNVKNGENGQRIFWFLPFIYQLKLQTRPMQATPLGKIPHTGDIESLDRCGQQHRYHSRVEKEYTKTKKTKLKTEKIIQNGKTQKRLETCQNQRYTIQPEVSNPSGSVVSTMFCKAKSAKNKLFLWAILHHFPTKMFNSETTSFQHFSPGILNL